MLLTTKVRSPGVPPQTLPRIELERQLLQFSTHKVILVSAPAGYGKTTLAVKFLKSISVRYAWYSLDRSDNNPLTFWPYFIQSLKRLDINLGKKSLALLNSESKDDRHAAIVQLLEDLNNFQARYLSGEHAIIVLDDFQDIWDADLLEEVNFFIEYLPDNIHLMITSRSTPPLHIAKRSARGELLLLVKEQLCLSDEEATDFVSRKSNKALSEVLIREVISAADGWLGALQILCSHLSVQQQLPDQNILSCLADTTLIKSYIDHEVLNMLEAECHRLLVKISPLPRFSEQMIYDVFGASRGKAWLKTLIDLNLIFAVQDEEGSWYSVHALIRERLIRLSRKLEIDSDLSDPLFKWLMERSQWSDIFEFAILTENWVWASRVALSSLKDITRSGQYQMVQSLMVRFPREVLDSMPKLSLFEVWADFQRLGHDHAKFKLQKLKSLTEKLSTDLVHCWPEYGIESKDDLDTLSEVIFVFEFQFKLLSEGPTRDLSIISRVTQYAQKHQSFSNWCWNGLGANAFLGGFIDEAIESLTKAYYQSQASNDGICLLASLACLGPSLIFSGEVTRVLLLCDETEQWCQQQGYDAMGLYSVVDRVRVLAYCELNKLEQASHHCNLMNQSLRFVDPLHKLYHTWAEVLLTLGSENQRCRRLVESLDKQFKSHYLNWHLGIPDPALLICILDVQDGQPKGIVKWAKAFSKRLKASLSSTPHASSQQFTFEMLVFCRFLLETGKNPTKEIGFLIDTAKTRGNLFLQLKAELLLAVYCYRKRDAEQALTILASVIAVADEKNMIGTVLGEDQLLASLKSDKAFLERLNHRLKSDDRHVGQNVTLRHLLDGNKGYAQAQRARQSNAPSQDLKIQSAHHFTALTKRELEVLSQLVTGLSNEQVGEALNISTTTVKTHVANVYSKLHVKNRTQAISMAREAGWV